MGRTSGTVTVIVCFPSPHWLMELLLSNILFVTIFHGLVFESKTLKEQLKEEKESLFRFVVVVGMNCLIRFFLRV